MRRRLCPSLSPSETPRGVQRAFVKAGRSGKLADYPGDAGQFKIQNLSALDSMRENRRTSLEL
jgi:hypothetical protein